MANAILIPQFEPDLSGFALKEHVHDQYLTAHQSLTNYATKTYVANQIAAIDFPDAGVLTFNGRAGAVEPKSGDYTADMVGAAPTNHSHSQYLTSHQSLSSYATKTWVQQQIAALGGSSGNAGASGTSESKTISFTIPKGTEQACRTFLQSKTVSLSGTAVSARIDSITASAGTVTLSCPHNINIGSGATFMKIPIPNTTGCNVEPRILINATTISFSTVIGCNSDTYQTSSSVTVNIKVTVNY